MYKILHLATGTFVMGNPGEDFSFINKHDVVKQMSSPFNLFIKLRGHPTHHVGIASALSLNSLEMESIHKHEFEIIEVPDD